MTIVSIDPGKNKCGLCVMTRTLCIVREIILSQDLVNRVSELRETHKASLVVLGNGTFSTRSAEQLFAIGIEVILIDEKFSTLEARKLYFKYNPPKGFRRLLPKGMLVPPVPYDDYVAEVIGGRFFEKTRKQT